MNNKVHIVDGNNYFSRMYFVGRNTLDAVVAEFLKFKTKNKGRIIVCFDTTKSERRLKLYPEYKAGRKSSLSEEEYLRFKATLNGFIDVVKNINISVLEGDGYEADDYIAMLCRMLKRYHVYIHSTDTDFLQLVSDRVSIIKPDREGGYVEITPENFFEHTGVNMEFYVDFKSMVGDSSDNIPGIEGIGPGKASKYINEYGCYEDIVAALKPKLNETVKSKRPTATEMKIIEGGENFSKARCLIDFSMVYSDTNLKNLVSKKVAETKLDLEKVLEVLSEHDSVSCFDVICSICKR